MGLGPSDSFVVLTFPLCDLQDVSGLRLVGFFLCPDLSISVRSPVGGWYSVGGTVSVS